MLNAIESNSHDDNSYKNITKIQEQNFASLDDMLQTISSLEKYTSSTDNKYNIHKRKFFIKFYEFF